MTTTRACSLSTRVEQVGDRIDELTRRAALLPPDTRSGVIRRVDGLRAKEAVARRGLRQGVSGQGPQDSRLLDRWLDEMDIELAVADAQLEADCAADGAAFEAAVRRQIDAHNAHVERILTRVADGHTSRTVLEEQAQAVRESKVAATEQLTRYCEASAKASLALRAEVLVALDRLDRAVAMARGHDQIPTMPRLAPNSATGPDTQEEI